MDAVRNLGKDSLSQQGPGENPGCSFIGYASGNGFATAPDLVRFAHALRDGTLLGPWATHPPLAERLAQLERMEQQLQTATTKTALAQGEFQMGVSESVDGLGKGDPRLAGDREVAAALQHSGLHRRDTIIGETLIAAALPGALEPDSPGNSRGLIRGAGPAVPSDAVPVPSS